MFKKVLALDCDGTLWNGIAGEGGVEPYIDFQKSILKLPEQGILLVLVSKNDEPTVWDVFDNNPNMLLKREDIITYRINWKEKSDNLQEIADELNLGLDSFVFWDDTPLERDKVRHNTPVIVPNIPKKVENWALFLDQEFYCDEITQEDINRVNLYKNRSKFQEEKRLHSNPDEFLKTIEMTPTIVKLEDNILRAEQLCAKTNQFNLTTIRHTKEEIANLDGFLVRLTDKYGDHGLVGLVLTKGIILDTFLMSCRVVQRNLEIWMLYQCCKRLKDNGENRLIAQYIPTPKNGMMTQFVEKFLNISDLDEILGKTIPYLNYFN